MYSNDDLKSHLNYAGVRSVLKWAGLTAEEEEGEESYWKAQWWESELVGREVEPIVEHLSIQDSS